MIWVLKPDQLEPTEFAPAVDESFLRLTRQTLGKRGAVALYDRLQRLEDEKNLNWLGAQP